MAGFNNPASLKARVLAELSRDKKRTALLGILAVVCAFVVGRALLRSVSSAGAAISTAAAIEESEDEGEMADAVSSGAGRPVEKAKKSSRLGERRITRDLFMPNQEFFPPQQAEEQAAPQLKTPASPAEDIKQALQKAVIAQARSLVLQSTVVGAVPTAMINGRNLAVSDWINGFEVTEVTTRSCTVRKQDVEVVLEMK